MKISFIKMLAIVALALPSVASAAHSKLTVRPSDTFMLGGDQGAAMTVSGTNVGQTDVVILSRRGPTETMIGNVSPGMTFSHEFKIGETALIRNRSTTATARISVDFTGSASSLSMKYALPPKN